MGAKKIIIKDTDAVILIDVQLTFMPGGGLPVQEGDKIIPIARKVVDLFPKERRYATKDRHRRGHICLASSYNWKMVPFTLLTYDMVKDWQDSEERLATHARFTLVELKDYLSKVGFQVLWPDHGIEDTKEAELHPEFPEDEFAHVEIKGMDDSCDSYGGFRDNLGRKTGLKRKIRKNHREKPIRRLFCFGLAFDYCVAYTAIDAATKEGFEVYIIVDATRSVMNPPGHYEEMLLKLQTANVHLIHSDDLMAA